VEWSGVEWSGVGGSGGTGCSARVLAGGVLRLLLMHRWNVNISNEEAGCCVTSCLLKCACDCGCRLMY
jgi:hypothetical protein